MNTQGSDGLAGRIARSFINSPLTPLIIVGSILLGLGAVLLLPREEEPQIKVPMVDVMVSLPGFTAREVEERATRPMEKLLWEIPGVEYVYSISRSAQSMVIVRFKVGEDLETSLVKLNQKLESNFDRIPPGVSHPLIKARAIDDVPILAITFHSKSYDHFMLRRLVAQIDDSVKAVPQVAETAIIGGARRQVRVLFDPVRLAARGQTAAGIIPTVSQANRRYSSGAVTAENKEFLIETGAFLTTRSEVENVLVGVYQGKPVYLKDVADIEDGPEELSQYVLFGDANKSAGNSEEQAAVTLTVAKRPGANAISVAEEVLRKIELLRGEIIPADISTTITRHYGKTAEEKSNELLWHMLLAVLSVSVLIALTLGLRESAVVALAIPSTLALTLLMFYLYGFTLNRITLFALIFSVGILVDDAIVVIENIVRHMRLESSQGKPLYEVAIEAVSEVGNPTILATFAVIFAVLPMAFVGGLMGPYMRPIPIGATAAMFFSLIIAFVVTPWASIRLLKHGSSGHAHAEEDRFTKLYRRVMTPIIENSKQRRRFLGAILALLLLSIATVAVGWVKVKMLPFDNKSEFQIILNMPEGSALERTTEAAREMARVVRQEPEVTDYQVYAGVAAPFNFNGLVRHYFTRRGASVADIQVNLLPKEQRDAQSHDVAKRVRPAIAAIAERYGARVAVAEVPPGPPVLQTLVAEVYGPTQEQREALATKVRGIFRNSVGVVDVDWYVEDDQPKIRFLVDREKAALNGISAETIAQTLRIALDGQQIDILHEPHEKEDVPIVLQLPRALRSSPDDLLALRVRSGDANALPEPVANAVLPLVPLRELVSVSYETAPRTIYHKNLLPVTYVLGDVAGAVESPVYAILNMNRELAQLDGREFGGKRKEIPIFNAVLPFDDSAPAIKWDGEWHITIEVFRDLGIAFGVVLVLIYILMVGWFGSFVTPIVVMAAIPFSLVGILPAHGLLGAFFTATSMIGFMAGAGIVVRNSIILVDFIELRLKEGMPLAQAVIDAGAVRFRPMMLTAMAVVVGASVILADPIFQGLAIALMAGEIASLLISRMAVPVLYYMVRKSEK
ncbi:MAG: efflux RND transporter permease subunit [Oligoflexia bacterium]|nr:efflux RND transporter permease subunit [Oligoflexia bacterium]